MENTEVKIVMARKQHRCDKCGLGDAIKPKDIYRRVTLWQQNDFPTFWKVCLNCQNKEANG